MNTLMKVKKLSKLLLNNKYRNALINSTAADVEHESILKKLNCNTVIDIGANKGQFALVSRNCFPLAQIFSFEPLAHPAAIFEKVFKNDKQTKLFRYAISNQSGEAEIHISHREDSSSLLPIAEKQNEIYPGTYEVGIEKINVRKLNELLKVSDLSEPVLLKIDVQGFELSVLQGSDELIGNIKYIYSECSYAELYRGQALFPEISSYLQSRGFKLTGEYNTNYDIIGNPVQSDFLFENTLI